MGIKKSFGFRSNISVFYSIFIFIINEFDINIYQIFASQMESKTTGL